VPVSSIFGFWMGSGLNELARFC